MIAYLKTHQGSATYLVAVSSSNEADSIILATNKAVMALGGFSGSDPIQLTGNLTMHGKINKEVFDVQGKVVGNTITGTATSTIYMTDFGIQPPNLANIAIAQNKVVISLTFTAKEA